MNKAGLILLSTQHAFLMFNLSSTWPYHLSRLFFPLAPLKIHFSNNNTTNQNIFNTWRTDEINTQTSSNTVHEEVIFDVTCTFPNCCSSFKVINNSKFPLSFAFSYHKTLANRCYPFLTICNPPEPEDFSDTNFT